MENLTTPKAHETMKKRAILLFWFLCLLPFAAGAQDGRQRTVETVVADVLAQLPAGQTADYRTLMDELAATGTEGIRILAGMLVPAGQGSDAAVEYALSGVVHHVTEQGRGEARDAVRQGLAQSIDACPDPADRAFLISLLACCSTAEDTAVFAKYADDGQLADAAVRGLIATPGSEPAILELMQQSDGPSARLAHAAAKRPSEGAEEILLAWLADYPSDDTTREAIYAALAACGGRASLRVLGDAAAAADFDFAPGDATGAFLDLLNNLAERGDTKVVQRAARTLAKESVRTNIRTAALELLLRTTPEQRTELLLAALGDNDRAYRCAALTLAADYTDEALCAAIVGEWPKLTAEARTDVVNWLGDRHAVSQTATVLAAIDASDPGLAAAAVRAAGRLGGQEALEALIGRLNGPLAEEAVAALASFNGQVDDGLVAALDADPVTQANALQLVARRRITRAADRVFALLDAGQEPVRQAALAALAGVTTAADFPRLCDRLDNATESETPQIQAGLLNALAQMAPEEQYARTAERMAASAEKARYYPLLAHTGTQEAIDALLGGDDRKAAFAALLTVESPVVPEVLFSLATEHPEWKDEAITRYTELVTTNRTPEEQVACCTKALGTDPAPEVKNRLLAALAGTASLPAVEVAARYLDDPATAAAAADAVRRIAAKSPGTGGETVVAALERARTVYAGLASEDADAGYAVDEINGLLARYAAVPRFELTEEEAAEGFEVLFDGLSLEKWTGNKTNYVPQEGTIYVTAQYGGSGNLYTVREYGDFILRFEFSFVRPGVNNGIGIRTPMGVDAAYHGMEIQVLDHDDPIYKNLHIYQQHGSVYGVIPAQKHVVFGEQGTWNTEEIRAAGDRITVTVNGEVILDGNIREACEGHNVAPDGSEQNPYTVDGRNHPGLFNKRGHIGLLGHGPGIRFRNIRIKEL